jgi:hypothetical protein
MKFPSVSHLSCHTGIVGLSPRSVKQPLALGAAKGRAEECRAVEQEVRDLQGGDGNRAIQCQEGIARGVRRRGRVEMRMGNI